MRATIRSLATANPSRYVTGLEAYNFMSQHFDMTVREQSLYRRLLVEGPIKGRYLGLDYDEQVTQMTADQQITRFQKQALATASRAASQAITAAGLEAADISGLVVNTCTGYLCPGLSSYLAEALHLAPTTRALDVMGMGCGGAVPNLQSACGMLALGSLNGGAKPVLSVAVEVCSATIYMGDDPSLIVSNCLFGDGAAAAVLCDETNGGHKAKSTEAKKTGAISVRILDFETGLLPAHREALRYHNSEGRLRNSLSRKVPFIAGDAVKEVAARLLLRHEMSPTDIRWWMVHPGGTAVLEQVGKSLGLTEDSLHFSHQVLRQYGNMSSPSVLFVLKEVLDQGRPSAGQRGLLLSFGAGFTAFAALVEF